MNLKFELMAEPRDVATRDSGVSANAWICGQQVWSNRPEAFWSDSTYPLHGL